MQRVILPNSAEYRRYAEVARQVAKQEQGSDHLWAELALFWENVAITKPQKKRSYRDNDRATDARSKYCL